MIQSKTKVIDKDLSKRSITWQIGPKILKTSRLNLVWFQKMDKPCIDRKHWEERSSETWWCDLFEQSWRVSPANVLKHHVRIAAPPWMSSPLCSPCVWINMAVNMWNRWMNLFETDWLGTPETLWLSSPHLLLSRWWLWPWGSGAWAQSPIYTLLYWEIKTHTWTLRNHQLFSNAMVFHLLLSLIS